MDSETGMTRRGFLGAPAVLAAQGRPSQPNILFLMSDQHRGDCLGADGNRMARTPNLDGLSKEGVRFRNAYSSTPTCTPARACLLTGLSPWHHGMLGYSQVAKRYAVEKPRVLREAGYYTMAIGKNHFTAQRNAHGYHEVLLDESGRVESADFRSDYRAWFRSEAPNLDPDATGIGWNDWRAKAYVLPERLHPTSWTGASAVRFLETYQRAEPFFLKVSFARPHSPYDPPERWMKEFADAELPRASVGRWAERWARRSDDSNDIWHGDMGAEAVRRSRQGYYGSVSFVDEQIGRVLEALEKRGWMENTVILYTSDHGDMTGDHHLWRKSYAYEASARVPMLLRCPEGMGVKRGQVREEPVELRDVLATFLDAAGTEREGLDGRSLIGLAKGKAAGWREWIDLEHDVCYGPENHWTALTDGRMKYIHHARDGEEQLFDLRRDRGEREDLAGVREWEGELKKWRERMIGHLSERGEKWVKGGRLARRPESMRLSPNYPREKE